MPTIPISKMPDFELVRLIHSASAELAKRMGKPIPTASASPESEPSVPVLSQQQLKQPDEDQKDFVLYVKARLQKGAYITADERRRVAEIAKEHRSWVARQGLPTEHNTGPWNKVAANMRVKRAVER